MDSGSDQINPLVMLQILFLGLIILFATNKAWLFGVEFIILLGIQYYKHIRMTGTESFGLVLGPGLWALLTVVNHSHGAWTHALWNGLHFGGALWFSILIVHLSSPRDMIHQVEKILKKWRVPGAIVGQMSMMALLVMRYIPELRMTAKRVNTDVRIRRQLAGNRRSWRDQLRFLTPLVMISILRSDPIAESIWARGWRPHNIPVVSEWNRRDSWITIGLWAVFLLTWKVLI